MMLLRTTRRLLGLLSLLSFFASLAAAHMSIWHPSMFAFNGPANCAAPDCYPGQDPVHPLGPGWEQDKWWFRGPAYRSELPSGDDAAVLPAGGSWTTEITCHKDYTSYGSLTTTPGEEWVEDRAPSAERGIPWGGSAHEGGTCSLSSYLLPASEECCPGSPGLYHSHLEGSDAQVKEGASGCALGIADVTSPDDATMDNIVIFSIQATCVWTRETTFDIPAAMPGCSGEWCICAWFWLAAVDLPNYYMTGFYCKIDGATSTVRWGSPLQNAVYCADDSSKCVVGPRRAMYAFNSPNNTPEWDSTNPNAKRPAYGSTWGWTAGAQTDIFAGGSSSSSNKTVDSAEGETSKSSASSGAAKTSSGEGASGLFSRNSATAPPSASSSAAPSSASAVSSTSSSSAPSISTLSLIVIPIMLLFAGWMLYRKWKAYQVSKKMAALVQRDEEKSLKKARRRRREQESSSGDSSSEEER